ncbi:hypothetical protein KEM55_003745, partial [Ascosphaera atra]
SLSSPTHPVDTAFPPGYLGQARASLLPPPVVVMLPREEDVLMSLQLLAYVSKYTSLRGYLQNCHFVPRLKIDYNSIQGLDGAYGGKDGSSAYKTRMRRPAAPGYMSGESSYTQGSTTEADGDEEMCDGDGDGWPASHGKFACKEDNISDDEDDGMSYNDDDDDDNMEEYLQPEDVNVFSIAERFTASTPPGTTSSVNTASGSTAPEARAPAAPSQQSSGDATANVNENANDARITPN